MTSGGLSARDYWNRRSDFREYYLDTSLFDRVFRRAVFVRAAVAVDVCKRYASPTVLDVGCGPGVNSVAMCKNGGARSVFGIDFAPTMIEQARAYARDSEVGDACTFVEGDFLDYSFGDTRFDVVAALGVFDYVEDAGSFLARMASLADGSVVASWPEPGVRMRLRQRRYDCPVYPYRRADVERLHGEVGFEHVEYVDVSSGCITIATPAHQGR